MCRRKLGIEYYASGQYSQAIPYLARAMKLSPVECHALPLYRIGVCLLYLKQFEKAAQAMDSSLVLDSSLYEAHRDLMKYAMMTGDQAKAREHYLWLERNTPWYWPHIAETLDRDAQGDWRAFLGIAGR